MGLTPSTTGYDPSCNIDVNHNEFTPRYRPPAVGTEEYNRDSFSSSIGKKSTFWKSFHDSPGARLSGATLHSPESAMRYERTKKETSLQSQIKKKQSSEIDAPTIPLGNQEESDFSSLIEDPPVIGDISSPIASIHLTASKNFSPSLVSNDSLFSFLSQESLLEFTNFVQNPQSGPNIENNRPIKSQTSLTDKGSSVNLNNARGIRRIDDRPNRPRGWNEEVKCIDFTEVIEKEKSAIERMGIRREEREQNAAFNPLSHTYEKREEGITELRKDDIDESLDEGRVPLPRGMLHWKGQSKQEMATTLPLEHSTRHKSLDSDPSDEEYLLSKSSRRESPRKETSRGKKKKNPLLYPKSQKENLGSPLASKDASWRKQVRAKKKMNRFGPLEAKDLKADVD